MRGKTEVERERAHIERMLGRAEKRRKQAEALVTKWSKKLAELGAKEVAVCQPRLWKEEHDDNQSGAEGSGG